VEHRPGNTERAITNVRLILIDIKAVEIWKKYVRGTGGTNLEAAGLSQEHGVGHCRISQRKKGLTMAYTYRTEQFGMSGAIGSIFKDGVFVWSTEMIQAFGRYDTDRKQAARIVRKRIAKLKQSD
jgi:hypothetical protein